MYLICIIIKHIPFTLMCLVLNANCACIIGGLEKITHISHLFTKAEIREVYQ